MSSALPDLQSAADPFAIGEGWILLLGVVGAVLMASVARALSVIAALLRQALALLGLLVACLALVGMLGYAAISSAGQPAPEPTTTPAPTARPSPRPAPPHRTTAPSRSVLPRAEPRSTPTR